jgi:REP element-mobilizing transposase RayT
MSFGLFDPKAEYWVTRRHLPHWEQPGATYFITWRTMDSLPRAVLQEWLADRDAWLRHHGLPIIRPHHDRSSGHGSAGPNIPQHLLAEYRRFVSDHWENRLDECHGECVLKRAELARTAAESLLHFDGERYVMGDFIVMPNHVHLLVGLPCEGQLLSQCRSWKRFTATEINKRLGRRGVFWQDESFDHLVRTPEELEHYQRYIAENPVKARLSEGSCFHYRTTIRSVE